MDALSIEVQDVTPKGRERPEHQAVAGIRKAAILLVVLGDEAASEVYRHLSTGEVQRLTQEISDLSYISPAMAAQVLQEYHQLSMTQDYLTQGGQEYANQLLVKAFGKEGAKPLLEQVLQAQA